MKKQLFLSILTAGLIGGCVQALGFKDLKTGIDRRDAIVFMETLIQYENIQEQDFIEDLKRLFESGARLFDNLYGYDENHVKFSARAIDLMFVAAAASEKERRGVVKFLLNNGANVDAQSPYYEDFRALDCAMQNNDVRMVQLLLDAGADVTYQNEEGSTLNNARNCRAELGFSWISPKIIALIQAAQNK